MTRCFASNDVLSRSSILSSTWIPHKTHLNGISLAIIFARIDDDFVNFLPTKFLVKGHTSRRTLDVGSSVLLVRIVEAPAYEQRANAFTLVGGVDSEDVQI